MGEIGSREDSRIGATEPVVQVFTLGRFEVVGARGKMPKGRGRPLTLLKVLVALGGDAVPTARLSDSLWPDADGYAAHRALITNVHRLRSIIGHSALLLRGGRLSLDAHRCRVDALRLVESLDKGDKASEPRSILRHAAEFLALYRGKFLPGEFEPPEIISTRTRLHSGLINGIASASSRLIRHGRIDEAVDLLLRALVLDDQSEILYRQLMLAYNNAGRWADGIDVYRRCRQTLRECYGVAPSAEVERLHGHLASRGQSALGRAGEHVVPAPTGRSHDEQHPATVVLVESKVPFATTEDSTGDACRRSSRAMRQRIGETITSHGGAVHESSVDSVLGIFGVPTAHEDDAVRAVRACRALVKAPDGTTHKLPNGTGRRPVLRCAVESGLVTTYRGSESTGVRLDGKPFHEVKRLVTRANASDVIVGEQTKSRVEDYFVHQSVRVPKGAKSSAAYRVAGETGIDSHFAAAKARGLAPFTGRQGELLTLQENIKCAAAGEGRTVILSGEPGIGKSRLLYELVATIDRNDTTVVEAGCRSFGDNTPYFPFVHALRNLLALDPELPPEDQAREVLDRTRAIAPALEKYAIYYQSLLTLPVNVSGDTALPATGVARRRTTKEAIGALIVQISVNRPLVLVLEDWHWADESSHEVLQYLQALVSPYRVLVIVSHRSSAPPEGLAETNVHLVRLGPLGDDDSRALVGNMIGAARVPDEFARLVGSRAGGNPFFIEEICRGVRQRRNGGGFGSVADPRGPAVDFEIPDTVQGMIRNRLDQLDADAREVALDAAVIGRDFSLRVLAEVHGNRETLEDHLDRLKAQGLIQQTSVLPEVEFRFQHALTQLVAYEALSPARRRALHERVARVIERLQAARLDEHVEALARHFSMAENLPPAVEYLERAGDKAARAHAGATARAHYRKAIELLDLSEQTPETTRLRIELSFKWVDVSYYVSAHEALEILARSRTGAKLIGDAYLEARVDYWTGRVHHVMGNPKDALGSFRRALASVPARRSGELAALLHACIGRAAHLTGDFAGAVEALERGLAGLDPKNEPDEVCYSTSFLAMTLAHKGAFDRSFPLHEKALCLARETGDLTHEAAALVRLVISLVTKGDWQAAMETGQDVVRIAERIENPMLAGFAMFDEGHSRFMLGDRAAGVARCEEGRRLVEESGSQLGFSLYLANLSELYALAGQFERAADVAERAIAGRRTGERLGVYAAYRALALIAEHRTPSQPRLSQARLAYAHRLASAVGARPAVAVGRLRRAEMCLRQRQPRRAVASLREATHAFESMGMIWWLDQAKLLQVSPNAARGPRDLDPPSP